MDPYKILGPWSLVLFLFALLFEHIVAEKYTKTHILLGLVVGLYGALWASLVVIYASKSEFVYLYLIVGFASTSLSFLSLMCSLGKNAVVKWFHRLLSFSSIVVGFITILLFAFGIAEIKIKL